MTRAAKRRDNRCLIILLLCFCSILFLTSCQGNGGAVDSGGATYSSGDSPSGGVGGMTNQDGNELSAWDIKNLADEDETDRIVELLTQEPDTGGSSVPGPLRVVMSASDIGLPPGGSVVLTMSVDGRETSYTATADADGTVSFDIPAVPEGSEVTVSMDVYDGSGTLLLTGSTSKTVSGETDSFSIILSPVVSLTVSFDTGGGSAVESQAVAPGGTASEPPTRPTRAGYFFAGWYTAASGGTEYDFSSPVTANITLYARWRTAAQFLDSLTESDVQVMNPTGTGTIAPDYTALKDTPVYFKLADGSYGALIFTDVSSDYNVTFLWRKIPGTATVKSGFQIRWGFDLNGNYTNDDTKDFGLDSNGGSYSFTAYNGATFCVGNAP